ncbi:MAG: hypothetical protein KAW56_02925 [Candidatus Marinimicrobia bacterium]|nr:hypothetical protein [Candidatus Neomarinimicrobiota bacterium]
MNSQLEAYARQKIKEGLSKLSEGHQIIFKRMYSHENLKLPIDKVVDNMPKEKLDWALTQVQNSLNKIQNEKGGGKINE